jgi:hypothetical protein
VSILLRFSVLLLTTGLCGHAASQTGSGQQLTNKLIDLRAKEVVIMFKYDNDAVKLTDELANALKSSDVLKTTAPIPCPPSPTPGPKGSIPKLASASEWQGIVLPEANRQAAILASQNSLTESQRGLLLNKLAPEFGRPGDPTKFSTVIAPACPPPPNNPVGAEGKATSGAK